MRKLLAVAADDVLPRTWDRDRRRALVKRLSERGEIARATGWSKYRVERLLDGVSLTPRHACLDRQL